MNDTKSKAAAYTRKYRYGITEEQYDRLLIEQGNCCAVCKDSFEQTKPWIDHDHNCCEGAKSCGKCLRGLLCSSCLTLASIMETRFHHMDGLFEYLTKYLTSEVNK